MNYQSDSSVRPHQEFTPSRVPSFIVTVIALGVSGKMPLSLLAIYFVISIITFAAYAIDKSAAQKGAWRTSESTLHLFSLLGGWPGAIFAQQKLRHKTKKQSFRSVFWITVLLNLVIFSWLLTPSGAAMYQSYNNKIILIFLNIL